MSFVIYLRVSLINRFKRFVTNESSWNYSRISNTWQKEIQCYYQLKKDSDHKYNGIIIGPALGLLNVMIS